MCRILAKISLSAESLSDELVTAEHSLKKQAGCGNVPPGDSPGHADGCGVAYVQNGQIQVVRRGRENNWDDSFVDILANVRCQLAVGHNRKASSGLKPENVGAAFAHPFPSEFKGSQIAFCHNGGVKAVMEQANARNLVDSQILLEDILKGIHQLNAGDISERLSQLARQYSSTEKKWTSITGMLLSPTHVFAWLLYRPVDEWYEQYYTLWLKQTPERVIIASEPIDHDDNWQLLTNGAFLAINLEGQEIDVHKRQLDLELSNP